MMSVLHGDRLGFEPVSVSKSADFFGVVVGHQKIAMQLFTERKKFFMVHFGVCVKPRTGTRPASGVWRVNKKDRIFFFAVFGHHFKSIAMNKLNAFGNEFNVGDAFCQSLRIPARQNPFPILRNSA